MFASMFFSKTSKSIDRFVFCFVFFNSRDVSLSSSGIRGDIFIICLQLACFVWKPEQFELQGYGGCVTQGYDRVCRKIYTYLTIWSLFRR